MTVRHLHHLVTPAKAGVHSGLSDFPSQSAWMPAFAGMTVRRLHPLVTPAKAGVHSGLAEFPIAISMDASFSLA
jgi:hypothetical protein